MRVDRTGWPKGPWDDEPDEIVWLDDGDPIIACAMVRNSHGSWCGYVGVPPTHPWHGKNDHNIEADVHGGLTFADDGIGVQPGLIWDEGAWWVGFDCAHAWDACPGLLRYRSGPSDLKEVYRDVVFVRAEVIKLVQQARDALEKS